MEISITTKDLSRFNIENNERFNIENIENNMEISRTTKDFAMFVL